MVAWLVRMAFLCTRDMVTWQAHFKQYEHQHMCFLLQEPCRGYSFWHACLCGWQLSNHCGWSVRRLGLHRSMGPVGPRTAACTGLSRVSDKALYHDVYAAATNHVPKQYLFRPAVYKGHMNRPSLEKAMGGSEDAPHSNGAAMGSPPSPCTPLLDVPPVSVLLQAAWPPPTRYS
jgi:hypothetical protein